MTAVTSIEGISLKHLQAVWHCDRVDDGGRGYIVGYTWVGAKQWAHIPDCECAPEHTYTCQYCGRRFGWCIGGTDEIAPCCDFCWVARPYAREALDE